MKLFVTTILMLFPLLVVARVFDGKTSAYFVDRYGPAKSSNTVSSHPFTHTKSGGVVIKGQFIAREFRDGELPVQPVFFLPSMAVAAIRLQLNRAWTSEQIEAALAAYGGEWRPISSNDMVKSWVAPDGSIAISMLTWIDINAKAVVDLVQKNIDEDAAKRKAIPKF